MPGGALGGHPDGSMVFCFLSEDFYVQTRLQFDETAKQLQKLENATRRAVCAAVKEFNKTQVCPGSVWRGRTSKQMQPRVACSAGPCSGPV